MIYQPLGDLVLIAECRQGSAVITLCPEFCYCGRQDSLVSASRLLLFSHVCTPLFLLLTMWSIIVYAKQTP